MSSISSLSQGMGFDQYKAFLRMSTGLKINQASDNAAGLAISEKLRGQVRGENMAVRNMSDSQSMLRVAEGALDSTHSVLQRMRELSIQANNGLLTTSDRRALQNEFTQLKETIDSIGKNTQFNTKPLLDGSLNSMNTTTGANGSSLNMSIDGALSSQLGDKESGIAIADIDLVNNPQMSLKAIDEAIQAVSGNRGKLGAMDNRLEHSINNSRNAELNQQAAESRIRDADLAKSAMELQQYKIMQQSYFAVQRMGMDMMGMNLNLLG